MGNRQKPARENSIDVSANGTGNYGGTFLILSITVNVSQGRRTESGKASRDPNNHLNGGDANLFAGPEGKELVMAMLRESDRESDSELDARRKW